MKTENEGYAVFHYPKIQLATCRKFLGTAQLGLGCSGLIRAKNVFSMAQYEDEAVHQIVSEHARRDSLPADAFDLSRSVPDLTKP